MTKTDTDIVDTIQVLYSKAIGAFLDSVKPGRSYAFFDLDGTITSPKFDVEDYAVTNYLIPKEAQEEWAQKVLRKFSGDFRYIYKDRKLTREAITKVVTANIARDTRLKVGTVISAQAVYQVGLATGRYLLTQNYQCMEAVELMKLCQNKNVHIVVLTASPTDVARGVMESIKAKFDINRKIVVLGSEYIYGKHGVEGERVWMRGPNKTYVVEEVKRLGARAVLGAGDSPSYSDAFVEYCEIPVVVDQKDGKAIAKAWEQARDYLSRCSARLFLG